MSASEFLRNEHQDILRLEKVITKSYKALYAGVDIPFSDIDKINFLIAEFLDSVHFTREEGSYFPCVASYDHLNKEIRELLIEHEFSRNIARSISKNLKLWKEGQDKREPVARFLRCIFDFSDRTHEKRRSILKRLKMKFSQKKKNKKCLSSFNQYRQLLKR